MNRQLCCHEFSLPLNELILKYHELQTMFALRLKIALRFYFNQTQSVCSYMKPTGFNSCRRQFILSGREKISQIVPTADRGVCAIHEGGCRLQAGEFYPHRLSVKIIFCRYIRIHLSKFIEFFN